MLDELGKLLARADAHYADIRYEVKRETNVSFRGRELTELSASSADGYVLRVLQGGGFASVAFTRPDDAEQALRTAVTNAVLMGRAAGKPVRLAETQAIRAPNGVRAPLVTRQAPRVPMGAPTQGVLSGLPAPMGRVSRHCGTNANSPPTRAPERKRRESHESTSFSGNGLRRRGCRHGYRGAAGGTWPAPATGHRR